MTGIPIPAIPLPPRHVAFVREQVKLDRPPAWISHRLWEDGGWLLRSARQAVAEAHLRHCPVPCNPEMPTAVLLGAGRRSGDTVCVPMRWEGIGHFALLDGTLELRPDCENACQFRLDACYRQTYEAVGKLRTSAFNDVAASTARIFLVLVAMPPRDQPVRPANT